MHFGDNSGKSFMQLQFLHFRDNSSLSIGIFRVYLLGYFEFIGIFRVVYHEICDNDVKVTEIF